MISMSLNIHWLIPGTYADVNDITNSQLASIRMRVAVSGLAFLGSSNTQVTFGDQIAPSTNVVLVGKIGADCQNGRAAFWLKQLQQCKSQGTRVVIDYTDNHLQNKTSMTDFYSQAIALADACIASSTKNAENLSKHISMPCHVIEEPLEIPLTSPKETFSKPTKILWFGHATNVEYLSKFIIEKLQAKSDLCEVIALSNGPGLNHLSQVHSRMNFRLKLTEWSIENMQKAAFESDVIVIPSDPHDPKKMGASSNRLITSFALGLPVIASYIEAYLPYRTYFVDVSSEEMFEVIRNPADYVGMTKKAQELVLPQYSVQSIQQKWIEAIHLIASS